MQEIIKGYKVFRPDFTSEQGNFQYAENQLFEIAGAIKICSRGFHFCEKASDCFNYYSFDPNNVVCEVESRGEAQRHDGDSKICTDKIYIGRRLSWDEVLKVANEGVGNTGYANSGYSNSGYSNSGDRNSGDSNSGDRNSGDSNSGYSNSGYSNSGYSNSGYRNSGNWNSGDSNSGYRNSGDSNSGDRNSGYSNSGDRNSGDSNSGDRNSGDSNSGNWNSGNWNSGDRNSGDSNSGYRSAGAFCTSANPEVYLFDKPSGMNAQQWESSEAYRTMCGLLEHTIWVDGPSMSNEEKEANPKWEITGGYLKVIPLKESWKNMWGNLSEKKRAVFTSLPNFDWDKFTEITGIQKDKN